MFPRWNLLYNSICSGFFQKNYFNILQLMCDIWTADPTSLACWNFFHDIKLKLSLKIYGVTMMLYGGKKKNPNKPNKSPNWKALHYNFSFFYKFSLTSGDLPSLYWASMNKLRREVTCLIRSIYKANLKLLQQSCSDACGAWYPLCWSQRYIHIRGRL